MRHIDFVLQKCDLARLRCELAVEVHAWLMTCVRDEYAKDTTTSDNIRPFSLFARVQPGNIAMRLSLLHETAVPLLRAVRSARIITASGLEESIAILNSVEKTAVSLDQLRKPASREICLILASPATYRHNHQPSNLYSLSSLLFTVAAKLRRFEGLDISNEEILELCDLVTYSRYELRSVEYQIRPGIMQPGFEGELLLRPGGNSKQRDQLALLLRYAVYSGVGAKTALGMGGVLLME